MTQSRRTFFSISTGAALSGMHDWQKSTGPPLVIPKRTQLPILLTPAQRAPLIEMLKELQALGDRHK